MNLSPETGPNNRDLLEAGTEKTSLQVPGQTP